MPQKADPLDEIAAQWRRERPDVDFTPLEVVGRILLLQARLSREFDAVARRHGLARGLVDVLAALRRSGAPYRLLPTDLFNTMMLTSGGMTHRLDRLERMGLIERGSHPHDRRAVPVGLTAKGRKVIDAIIPEDVTLTEPLRAALSAGEWTELTRLLKALLAATAAPTSKTRRRKRS